MDDLAEFLRARLDEDEQTARAAASAERADTWTTFPESYGGVLDSTGSRSLAVGYGDVMAPETADHIARHDPARVLRDVEAKLRLMDLHRPYVPEVGQACLGCAGGIEFERCPVVRLLALPYADHPAYREAWRP